MSSLKMVCAEIIVVVEPCIRKHFGSYSDFCLEKVRVLAAAKEKKCTDKLLQSAIW